ncbi:hypothetical protein JXA02_05645 [candidate division KSB1 bacterium]|nr:hypothetical protein [candidate division KSB1 bacterium]RQW07882.1 MAG: hypothetical protein EH222_06455 [candidate division KSB1 bacterium]
MANDIEIVSFANNTRSDRQLLKKFIDFHWTHYENDPHYIPLLDYEYLGFKLIGMVGFFEPRNLFFKHADMRFFLAQKAGRVVGRCNAFVNHAHNEHWGDKVGFFGQFEATDDPDVAIALLAAASQWLKSMGMNRMRGPQNLPVNEATPGCLTAGFDSRPVMYYHYNKPYYEKLLLQTGLAPVKQVLSWEVRVQNPMEEKVARVAQKVIDRYQLTIEDWSDRPLSVRKQEMFEIYNDAWSDNWGFVPFTREEFYHIVDEMMLVMNKKLFLFVYVKGEPAAFFGAVLNIFEKMAPLRICRRCELLRAAKMLLTKNSCKGFRLGYLGVKKKFRRLGLDGVMIWKQKQYTQSTKLEYCDMGWVLEDNVMTRRLVEIMGAEESKTYTVFEKEI